MMHASDYANMGITQMQRKVQESKKNEAVFTKKLEDECRKRRKMKEAKESDDLTPEKQVVEKKAKKSDAEEAHGDDEADYAGDDEANPSQVNGNDDIILADGDMILSAIEDNDDNVAADNLKTYGKKAKLGKKKLIAKKKTSQLPIKNKAEYQFDKLANSPKKIDIEATDEQESKDHIKDLSVSFDAAKEEETKRERQEKEILQEICNCSKSIKKSSVEQTATMRAWSVKNNLDVEKFRKQVERELQKNDDQKPDNDANTDGPLFPPEDDDPCSGLVPLPEMGENENCGFDLPDSDDINYNDNPYPNQEADPEIRNLMFRDFFDSD